MSNTPSDLLEAVQASLATEGQELDTAGPEMPPIRDRVLATDSQGYLYDVDTGEVVGHEAAAPGFEVDTREAVDWALKIRCETEAQILAIESQIAAITANLNAQKNELVRRLAWWDLRFASRVMDYAKGLLSGQSKTVHFTYGKVSWRASAGSTEINDESAALEFVRTWCPDRIKVTESVGIKATLEALAIARGATGEQETPIWLIPAKPSVNCTIDTGVLTTINAKGKK